MSSFAAAEATVSPTVQVSLYRAIWRWHFFAGLLVVPFMLNLAITGSLYLFKDQIADTFYNYRNVVMDHGPMLAPQIMIDAAVDAFPGGQPVSYQNPVDGSHSAVVTLSRGGQSTLVYVNPHDGHVLGGVASSQEFSWVVKKIHSLEFFGAWTNRIIEIVAGFALVLVTTGMYLWWPRRQAGGVVTVRGTPAKRVFWRDLHAVTGAFAGLLIFFLALTGMPWSGYWGANVNAWLTAHDLGTPAALWDDVPKSSKTTQDVVARAGWVVENAPVPASRRVPDAVPISVDRAVKIATSMGMSGGFDVSIPSDDTGVYTATHYFGNLAKERTIHIDQYSGQPLVDISFEQYPMLARVIEWGINVHQGMEWGLLNQILMLATCLAIILCCVSGVVMWWKRRPSGRVGVPPMPPRRAVYLALYAIVIPFGVVFPLTGAAILAMIAFDQVVIRRIPLLDRAFS